MMSKGISNIRDALRRIEEYKEDELSGLNLSGLNLLELPGEVFDLKNITFLGLMENQLTELPKEILKLENLAILLLSKNQLSRLPEEIWKLKELSVLYIDHNQLTSYPKGITQLANLTELSLSDNRLSELPAEITKLKKLERLILNNNRLKELPKGITRLENLEYLDLRDNELIEITKEIGHLKKLEKLFLSGNENLISPPPSVVERGTNAILNYLRAMDEKIKVWTSKMILVGQGEVGKTCLLDALEGKSFECGKSTTHGIDIRQLSFPCPQQEDICMELKVWDFGGQDIYHATHQFYLTNHSLVLLVWSARMGFEAGKLYRWMETIQALAPDSPVLIVATHCKERGSDLPKGDILSKYPGKVHFFEVDNENKQGIKELKEAIQTIASDLKYMGIERPKSWVDAAGYIQQLDKQYISKKELFDIFEEYAVDEENYETLAEYLHELGDILYYPAEEELKDTIIVKPVWVSRHIAYVLDNDEVSKRGGFLNKKLMQQIWSDLEPHLHDRFIALMEKFDLSYKIEGDDEICLIVEKLRYEEHPEYKELWENFEHAEREIAIKYELETIPAGIPTWFIARTHRFTKRIHWRYGVLLEDEAKKHLALVIASPENKEIWLKVKGIMPYYFFALLRDILELTFNRFEGLKRKAKIPCPGHKGKPCPHFFALNNLEKKIAINKFKIQCPEAIEDEHVKIMKMLFGLSYSYENKELAKQIGLQVKAQLDEQKKILRKQFEEQNKTMRATLEEQFNKQTKQMQDGMQELAKFMQLEFIKSYKVQQKIMDATCPNLFTLKPKTSSFFTRPIDVDEYELQFYCQKPGFIHPVQGGRCTVKIPKKWMMDIAPYYNKALKMLKLVLPVFIPAAGKVLGDDIIKGTGSDLKTIKEYINKLPEIPKTDKNVGTYKDGIPGEAHDLEDVELRHIRDLLDRQGVRRHWGDLQRVVTLGGHILWLCKEHAEEYEYEWL